MLLKFEATDFIFIKWGNNLGGPGGGKTRYATQVRDLLADKGIAHICVPDLVLNHSYNQFVFRFAYRSVMPYKSTRIIILNGGWHQSIINEVFV